MDVKRVFAKLTWTQLLGNLFGALLTWFYFRFVDYTAAQFQAQISRGEIVYFVLGFAALIAFGITCVAGTVTAALIFFAVEHQWRRVLPAFFPGGDLSAVPGVLRLRVRVRLLVIFLVLSVIPLSLLGVLAYTRAAALPGVDPTAAPRIVANMLVFIVFIVAVGILAAVGLSLYVASSVAGPLGQLQTAMRDVERGDLETRCPGVT